MIRFICPSCDKTYKAADELAGKETVCKKCGAVVMIPDKPIKEVLYGEEPPPKRGSSRKPDEEDPITHQEYEEEYEEEFEEELPRYRRRRVKPGKVTAIGGMLIGGGICAILNALGCVVLSVFYCCFWPGIYFAIVWAIFAIIKGSGLLGDRWFYASPRVVVILQIVQIINLDLVNLAMGIIGLVFLSEREMKLAFGEHL